MYGFFKSVLNVAKEKHKKALAGKGNGSTKLQRELLEIQGNLVKSYKYNELTKEQYEELAKEFAKISFVNLGDQRNGKLKW